MVKGKKYKTIYPIDHIEMEVDTPKLNKKNNMSDYVYSEMEVELTKINHIFEKFIPPETELGKAVKYYKWENKGKNDLVFGLFLGLLEFYLTFSLEKNRGNEIDYLLLLSFEGCCDKLEVINEEKKQLRAFWFWNDREASWLLTASASSEFSVNFECANNLIKELKYNPIDLVNISGEIQPQDINMQNDAFVFKQSFGWTLVFNYFSNRTTNYLSC